jgi:hypothetical protein
VNCSFGTVEEMRDSVTHADMDLGRQGRALQSVQERSRGFAGSNSASAGPVMSSRIDNFQQTHTSNLRSDL